MIEDIKSHPNGQRYALCIGIPDNSIPNSILRFAVKDAQDVAELLRDPQRGNFEVTLLTKYQETTKQALEKEIYQKLRDPKLKPEDLVVLYISCHGATYGPDKTFYLLPSDTRFQTDSQPDLLTVLDIHDITRSLSNANVKNIILFLDACYSGGAGEVIKNLSITNTQNTNLYIIGAARHDQKTPQSSELKHSVFAYHLLQAFEQPPRQEDGWITVSEILSFVDNAFKEKGGLQFQTYSTTVNHNLGLVQNPQYLPESRNFAERVKTLLELGGFKPLPIELPQNPPAGYYVAEVKGNNFSQRRSGVIPYYNEYQHISQKQAQNLGDFIKQQYYNEIFDEVKLVVAKELDKITNEIIIACGIRKRDIKIITCDQLLENLIDFSDYLEYLILNYQKPNSNLDQLSLSDIYINPLNTQNQDLEIEVRNWLATPDKPSLAILADYGSGKTVFSQHLAAKLAEEYKKADQQKRGQCRIPLLVNLREFARYSIHNFEGFLYAYLNQNCKVDNPNYHALISMARSGLILFILDGFDEMAQRAYKDVLEHNMELLNSLALLEKNKILLTTRPEYFTSLSEEQNLLKDYQTIFLSHLNEEQIKGYLQKRIKINGNKDWNYYFNIIEQIPNLLDLAQRPVLLEMIVKTLPTLERGRYRVNRPSIYQDYLEEEIKRQKFNNQREMLIDKNKRFEIIEKLAIELYKTGTSSLPENKIRDLIINLLTPEQQRSESESYLREFLTCSFLNRIGNEYLFSHQSFMEYFVASRLAKDISEGIKENIGIRALDQTILGFLIQLERHEQSEAYKYATFDRSRLEVWLRNNCEEGWITSNAATLLSKLEKGYSFGKANIKLEHAHLSYADLSFVDLSDPNRNQSLNRAILSKAILIEANLSRITLSNANLIGANLRSADLRQANLIEADLRSADLRQANLIGADLRSADLRQANLIGANLRSADLRQANLIGANLRSADLTEANLTKAKLNGADLTEANLTRADVQFAECDQFMDYKNLKLTNTKNINTIIINRR